MGILRYATGEAREPPLRSQFRPPDQAGIPRCQDHSDSGLLAYGELDHAVGLVDTAVAALSDRRRGRNIRHRLPGLLRQSVLGRIAGYEDVNDAERLARDPAMRAIVGREGLDRAAASSSQMGRFETERLAIFPPAPRSANRGRRTTPEAGPARTSEPGPPARRPKAPGLGRCRKMWEEHTTRKPMLLFRLSGLFQLRLAQRALS